MINETLDNLFAKCQQLSDDELESLLNGIMTERQNRQDREQRAAWERVCEAVIHYTANYGSIRVSDYDDGNTVVLEYGCFTYSAYGDIEVGA